MAQATDIQNTDEFIRRRDEQLAKIPALDHTREFVSSGVNIGLSQLIVALPKYADDLQREQSDEIYYRMMSDPSVNTAVQTLIEIALMNEIRIESAITDEDDPDFETAKTIRDFVESNINALRRPLNESLSEMMNAFVFGSCVAEQIFEFKRTSEFGLKLHLVGIKPLSRDNYSFVVDDWGNVAGFMVRRPGESNPMTSVFPELIVPREKFAVLAFGVVAGDPRGRSQIRSAYNSWWFKLHLYPAWLKYLQCWSTPSLIGFTPEGEEDTVIVKDANGNPVFNSDGTQQKITREQALLQALVTFQGNSALALKGGSRVEPIQSTGNGEAFIETLDALNREIMLAIIGNARANMEAAHGSKADSESGQDTLSRKADWIINHIESMLQRDVINHLVLKNWPPELAERCMPWITLKAADKEDRASIMGAVASLWREKYFHKSQIAGLDQIIGAPERDIDAWLAEIEAEEEAAAEARVALSRTSDPMQGFNRTGE